MLSLLLLLPAGGGLRHCEHPDEVSDGTWVEARAEEGLWSPPGCDAQQHFCQGRNLTRWRWQPRGCRLPSFNSSALHQCLSGRPIHMVGDSIIGQLSSSLNCLMPQSAVAYYKSAYLVWFEKATQKKRSKAAKAADAAWGGHLAGVALTTAKPARALQQALRSRPALLVLGAGEQHWLGDHALELLRSGTRTLRTAADLEAAYLVAAHHTMAFVNHSLRGVDGVQVVWVTGSPDHFTQPWYTRQQTCKHDTPSWEGLPSSYARLQRLAAIAVGAAKQYGFSYLNITGLSAPRRDAHALYSKSHASLTPDCVHWCIPGVPDVWAHLLFTLICRPP
eukprot:EG_transcript_15225